MSSQNSDNESNLFDALSPAGPSARDTDSESDNKDIQRQSSNEKKRGRTSSILEEQIEWVKHFHYYNLIKFMIIIYLYRVHQQFLFPLLLAQKLRHYLSICPISRSLN